MYGKMLILTFEDREEEILNHIISYVSTGARAFQVIENAKTNLSFNGLEIDDINRSVRKQKQEIDLTFTEFEILYLLANNPGRVFSKEQIYDIVWKESYSGDYNIVMSHIRNIREKIEDNPSKLRSDAGEREYSIQTEEAKKADKELKKENREYEKFLSDLSTEQRNFLENYMDIVDHAHFQEQQRAYYQGIVDAVQILAGLGMVKESVKVKELLNTIMK